MRAPAQTMRDPSPPSLRRGRLDKQSQAFNALLLESHARCCEGPLDWLLHAVKNGGRDCRHDDGGRAGEQEGFHRGSPKQLGMP